MNKICLLEAKSESLPLDAAIEIYQQIQSELIPTEYSDEQIKEYYDYEQQVNAMINNEILTNQMKTNVVCPVCLKWNLTKENNVIKCCNQQCQFNITTNLTLSDLSSRLETALKQHPCNEAPSFEYKNCTNMNDVILMKQLGLTNQSSFLMMSCDRCCFNQFIV